MAGKQLDTRVGKPPFLEQGSAELDVSNSGVQMAGTLRLAESADRLAIERVPRGGSSSDRSTRSRGSTSRRRSGSDGRHRPSDKMDSMRLHHASASS